MNLTIGELSQIIGGQLRFGSLPPFDGEHTSITRIVADSQQATEGSVFWGLPGDPHDGSRFAEEAYLRKALGAVVSGRSLEPWAGKFSLEVENSHWSLWKLAAWCRRRYAGRVITVSGDQARSTTRRMIEAALAGSLCGEGAMLEAGEAALPLSLVNVHEESQFCALEIPLETRTPFGSLPKLCLPQIGVVTGGELPTAGSPLPSQPPKRYADLFAAVGDSGWLVLNGDDPQLRRAAGAAKGLILWVGRSSHNDLSADNVTSGDGRLSFTVDGQPFTVPVWGRHHLTPALAAIGVGRLMGLTDRTIAASLERYEAPAVQFKVHEFGGVTALDDRSRCTLGSMRSALGLLRDFPCRGRRIVVCGGLSDAGLHAVAAHRLLGDEVVTQFGADRLFACGEYAAEIVLGACEAGMPAEHARVFANCENSAAACRNALAAGDVVLVKGAHQFEAAKVIQTLQQTTCPNIMGTIPAPLEPFEVSPFAAVLRETNAALPPG